MQHTTDFSCLLFSLFASLPKRKINGIKDEKHYFAIALFLKKLITEYIEKSDF